MGSLFAYSLTSSLMLAAMYLVFKWMLAGENQHRYNRLMLWLIYSVALLLPALLPALRDLAPTGSTTTTEMTGTVEAGLPIATVIESEPPLLPRIFLGIYLAGIAVTLVYTAIVALKLAAIISKGERLDFGRYTIIITRNAKIAPFSWCRYIVMTRDDYNASAGVITLHETRHLDAHHWIDLIIAQFVAIFQWYNPAAWLMREELKTVHEFQADEAVITAGTDPKEYQMLLIKKAVGARFPSLANSLNHSKLKKRVTMMYKSKSSTARRLRALALLPAGALALLSTGIPAVASAIAEADMAELTDSRTAEPTLPADKVTEIQPETQISELRLNGKIHEITTPDGGTVKMHGTTDKNGTIHVNIDAAKKDAASTDYTISINKKPADKESLKTADATNVESVTVAVVNGTKNIDLALNNSSEKNSSETFPLSIGYLSSNSSEKEKTSAKASSDSEQQVFTAVEKMPQYPGGEAAMMKFVGENIKYPKEAEKAGTQGRVVIRFVVGADGKVSDAKVLRSVSPEIDAEALRMVSSFPPFIPGEMKGKPVACQYVIPLTFKLSGNETEQPATQQAE